MDVISEEDEIECLFDWLDREAATVRSSYREADGRIRDAGALRDIRAIRKLEDLAMDRLAELEGRA